MSRSLLHAAFRVDPTADRNDAGAPAFPGRSTLHGRFEAANSLEAAAATLKRLHDRIGRESDRMRREFLIAESDDRGEIAWVWRSKTGERGAASSGRGKPGGLDPDRVEVSAAGGAPVVDWDTAVRVWIAGMVTPVRIRTHTNHAVRLATAMATTFTGFLWCMLHSRSPCGAAGERTWEPPGFSAPIDRRASSLSSRGGSR
jgi:hypothetical protein